MSESSRRFRPRWRAERKYAEEDEQLAREFVALRGDLVELAPEAGEDAEAEHPG